MEVGSYKTFEEDAALGREHVYIKDNGISGLGGGGGGEGVLLPA